MVLCQALSLPRILCCFARARHLFLFSLSVQRDKMPFLHLEKALRTDRWHKWQRSHRQRRDSETVAVGVNSTFGIFWFLKIREMCRFVRHLRAINFASILSKRGSHQDFSPNSVSTLRGSYGRCKGRCLIRVLTLDPGILLADLCIKWLV